MEPATSNNGTVGRNSASTYNHTSGHTAMSQMGAIGRPLSFKLNEGVHCKIFINVPASDQGSVITTRTLRQALVNQQPLADGSHGGDASAISCWIHDIECYGIEGAQYTTMAVNENRGFAGVAGPTGTNFPIIFGFNEIGFGVEGGANPSVKYHAGIETSAFPLYLSGTPDNNTVTICTVQSGTGTAASETLVIMSLTYKLNFSVNETTRSVVSNYNDLMAATTKEAQLRRSKRIQEQLKAAEIRRIKDLQLPVLD